MSVVPVTLVAWIPDPDSAAVCVFVQFERARGSASVDISLRAARPNLLLATTPPTGPSSARLQPRAPGQPADCARPDRPSAIPLALDASAARLLGVSVVWGCGGPPRYIKRSSDRARGGRASTDARRFVASPSIDRARRSIQASSIALFGLFTLVGLARRGSDMAGGNSVAWSLQGGESVEQVAAGLGGRVLVGRAAAWLAAALYLASRGPQIWINWLCAVPCALSLTATGVGLSMLLFGMAFAGNALYTGSIMAHGGVDGEALPFVIGSAGTLCFDLTILAQSIIYSGKGATHRTLCASVEPETDSLLRGVDGEDVAPRSGSTSRRDSSRPS